MIQNQKSLFVDEVEIQQQGSKQTSQYPERRKVWSLEENILYSRFLKLHSQKFSVNDGDKKFRKYKRMSVFLVSKTPKQCRTHHQKMMIKFGKVENIIEKFSMYKNKEEKQQQKTEKYGLAQKMNEIFTQSKSQTTDDLEKVQKSIHSDSAQMSQMIFDILF